MTVEIEDDDGSLDSLSCLSIITRCNTAVLNFGIRCDVYICTYSEGKTARLFVEKSGSTSHNVTVQLATYELTATGSAVP